MASLAPKFKLNLLLLVSACLLLPSIQAKSVKYCDRKANYVVKVNDVDIIPEPVVAGENATFKISASSGEAISGGKVSLDVSLFGIHVHSEDRNLCEETSCPITAGDFVLSHAQTLPGFTPPGSYTLRMRISDDNKQQLTCISFGFSVSWGTSVSSI